VPVAISRSRGRPSAHGGTSHEASTWRPIRCGDRRDAPDAVTEPPHGADTGAPTQPFPRVDGPSPGALDVAGDHHAPAVPPVGDASLLHRGGVWLAGARHSRRRAALLLVALVVVASAAIAIADPFSSPTAPTASKSYSTTTLKRETLTSQTQVTATLGYSGTYAVTAASGTSDQNVMQDEQAVTQAEQKVQGDESATTAAADAASVTSAQQSLEADETTLQADQATLQGDKSTLAAEQAKEANDCAGTGSTGATCASDEQAVTQDQQKVTGDEQAVTQDTEKVTQDKTALDQATVQQSKAASQAQTTLSADEESLVAAKAALAADEKDETIQGGALSELPAVGQVVSEGQTLYTVGTTPVVLLYGTTPATRNLYEGERGPDVAQLNRDLRALGYSSAPGGDAFTASTAAAVDAFEAHIGVSQTGSLALGQVVFLPTAARVTAVSGVLGTAAQPGGTVLTASSTTRQVAIALDANLQGDVKVGDPVTITLPDESTTPGVVSYVGTVASVPSSSGNTHGTAGSSTPTVTVDVTPTDPSAIGNLDQAPVSVSITTASVKNALVVPVNALLALAGGGYALEVVPAHGPHYLVAVKTGLFDDAQGLVQVTGSQVHAGMRVVVPST
jgi:Putative peptidoglycan binding domain